MSIWTLFSNHGHVLLFLAGNSDARLRDVAGQVGITERAVQKIVRDLQEANMLLVSKHGRRNRYEIQLQAPLRHALESHCNVGQLVALVHRGNTAARTAAPRVVEPRITQTEPKTVRAKAKPPAEQAPTSKRDPAPKRDPVPNRDSAPKHAPEQLRAELPASKEEVAKKRQNAKKAGKAKEAAVEEDADQGSLF